MRAESGSRTTGASPRPARPLWRSLLCRLHLAHSADRLYLEVTHRCNLKCLGCYTGAGREKPDALSLQERKSVVRQARRMGARVVSLSGSGEPLLYEDLFPLIDFVRQLDMRVVMFTNGTRLTVPTAEFLISRGVVVYVQLPSLSPDVCDRMAGGRNCQQWADYSYRHDGTRGVVRLPAGLKNLLERCATKDRRDLVKLEALITRVNRASLPEVAAFSRQLGLGLHLETPIFHMRAIENYEQIALTEAEYAELYEKLVAILGAEYFQSHREQRCPVESNPAVWTNGDVAFCSSRGARVGNVREAPLSKLFARAERLKRKADRRIARQGRESRYFHTCPSRQHYEIEHGIPCNY